MKMREIGCDEIFTEFRCLGDMLEIHDSASNTMMSRIRAGKRKLKELWFTLCGTEEYSPLTD